MQMCHPDVDTFRKSVGSARIFNLWITRSVRNKLLESFRSEFTSNL